MHTLKTVSWVSFDFSFERIYRYLNILETIILHKKNCQLIESFQKDKNVGEKLPLKASFQVENQSTQAIQSDENEKQCFTFDVFGFIIDDSLWCICVDSEKKFPASTWWWLCSEMIPTSEEMSIVVEQYVQPIVSAVAKTNRIESRDEPTYGLLSLHGNVNETGNKQTSSSLLCDTSSMVIDDLHPFITKEERYLKFKPTSSLVGPRHEGFGPTTPFSFNGKNFGKIKIDPITPVYNYGELNPDHEPVPFGGGTGFPSPFL